MRFLPLCSYSSIRLFVVAFFFPFCRDIWRLVSWLTLKDGQLPYVRDRAQVRNENGEILSHCAVSVLVCGNFSDRVVNKVA